MILISSLSGSDEALASAGILIMQMQTKVMGIAPNGVGLLADYSLDTQEEVQRAIEKIAQALVVLVLMSQGSLHCGFQSRIIKESARDAFATCIPIFTPSFRFPDDQFYASLKRSGGDTAVAAYLKFFKRIALAFATHASNHVIEAQVADILNGLVAWLIH